MAATSIYETYVAYITAFPVFLAVDKVFTDKAEAEEAARFWNDAPSPLPNFPATDKAVVTTLDDYISLCKQDAAAGLPDRR